MRTKGSQSKAIKLDLLVRSLRPNLQATKHQARGQGSMLPCTAFTAYKRINPPQLRYVRQAHLRFNNKNTPTVSERPSGYIQAENQFSFNQE